MKSVINTQILFCNNVKETFDSKLCNMPFYASVKATVSQIFTEL